METTIISDKNKTAARKTDGLFTRRQRILLWLACSAIFFEAFDVSIVNLALPLIAGDLGIPLEAAQWIQTVYLLGFGGFLLLGGRLCDYAGSKCIFIIGMSIFGISSALASLDSQFWLLLMARIGQGIGAALAMPGGISLLSKHFQEGKERSTALGIFGAFAAIGFAGGLALGGIIASVFNWHWIFGINVPVILIVLLAAFCYVPAEPVRPAQSLHIGSAAWLTATLLLFSFSIHESTRLGWRLFPCLTLSLLSGLLLRRYDARQASPFFGKGIYPLPIARRALIASSMLGASFLAFVFITSLGLTATLHWKVSQAGLLLFPYSICSALVSKFLLPRLFTRIGVSGVGQISMFCMFGGAILLGIGIYTGSILFFLPAILLVNSCAIAIGYPAFTILALTGTVPEKQGIAAGLQSAVYTIGTGIGISLTGLLFQAFDSHTPFANSARLIATCTMISLFSMVAIAILHRKHPNP